MSSKRSKKVPLESFKIKNHTLRPGQCVMLRPPTKGAKPYIARIEHIEQQQTGNGQVMLSCRWYYRPEESLGGRRLFHGEKELFLSDHVDQCFPEAVECECRVHTLRDYTSLRSVESEDFFCRFQYNALTGVLSPDKVAVYCTCEMPFNPDNYMLFCTECQDLFHPECVGHPQKAKPESGRGRSSSKSVDRFVCPGCSGKVGKRQGGAKGGSGGMESHEGSVSRHKGKDVAAA